MTTVRYQAATVLPAPATGGSNAFLIKWGNDLHIPSGKVGGAARGGAGRGGAAFAE